VIVQHFPGLGAADTQPETEIPVVPRSVDDLYRFELVPYGAVTGSAGNTPARADGMQCANVRYQGENSRSMTRPVCVDEQAADQLMALDYFRSWRARGILISSSLGRQAIRRYYKTDPFPHRQVAREAFLAGNDLLYLADFGATPGEDPFANVTDTIKFFAERYENDPVFRAQVDQSLTRLLRLKLALYQGDLSWDNVQLAVNDIAQVGTSSTRLYTIADQSVTLIAPRRESLPPAPSRDENIVIFTDVRWNQQCSSCATYLAVAVNGLEAAVERLYVHAGEVRPDQW
jgi:beta-N-acetylhexosaminidase